MYQFNNVKSLQALITELLKLKDLVKCPICLDIVKNPVQVRCAHTFCSDCLVAFQNATSAAKNLLCPLCRKTIRTRKSSNCRVEHLAKFVQDVSDKLKTVFDCGDLNAGTVGKVISKLKERDAEDSGTSDRNTGSTNTIPATVSPNNTKSIKAKVKQKASLQQTDRWEEPLLYKSTLNVSPSNHHAVSPKKPQNDTFDQVVQTLVPTRYKNIRTYDRKKTSKAPTVTYNQLIDFEDSSNRMKIIEWLMDSRNCFGRVTQTQQEPLEPDLTPAFNFPSISQDGWKYMKTYTESLKKIRKSRAKFAAKSRHERRALSLDFAIGSYAQNPVFKRHSLACETLDFEEKNIEEVESQSDINDVMHLIEEDYLNTLENDMNLGNESAKAKGDLLTGQSIKEGTGWSRIKEIKRAINKKERKLKKLDVSFTPVSSSSGGKARRGTRRNSAEREAVVLLNRLPLDLDRLNKNEVDKGAAASSIQAQAHKVYNLNEIESYIEGNILRYISNAPGNISNEDNILEASKEVIEKPEIAQNWPGESKSCNKDVNKSMEQKPNVIKMDTLQSNLQENENDLIKEKKSPSPHKIMSDPEEDFKTAGSNNNDFLHLSNAGVKEKERESILQEDLFMQPTQITPNNDQRVSDGIEEKLEAIFNSQPEQEASKTHVLDGKQLNLRTKINLAVEMMNDFNKVFALSLNEYSPPVNEMPSRFQRIKLLCGEIHQLLEEDEKIKSDESLSRRTQDLADTATLRARNISTATTQTVHLNFRDAGIQTDEVLAQRGFRISSTASFKTQPRGFDAETQTDPFGCANCKSAKIFSQRLPSEVLIDNRDLIKHVTADKYEFTQSLDNIQFDTQDMVAKDSAKDKSQSKLQLLKKRMTPVSKVPSEYEFTQSLDDVQINTCDILRGVQRVSSKSPSQSTNKYKLNERLDDINFNTVDISANSTVQNVRPKENVESPDCHLYQSTNKYKLNESLDDINFNTVDITAEHERRIGSDKKKCSAESCLTFSMSTEAQGREAKPVNKSLQPHNVSKRFKRIRTPMSDSDSDSENPKKVAKPGNVHVRDDLSINFISLSSSESTEGVNVNVNGTKKDDTFALSIGGSENIDYDEYLEKIMKKYDKEIPCSTPKHARLKDDNPRKRKVSQSQEVADAPHGKKVNKDKVLVVTKQKDNFSESLFSNGSCPLDVAKAIKAPPPLPLNDVIVNSVVDEFKKHLQESEKDAPVLVDTVQTTEQSKVTILQNILLKPKDSNTAVSKLPYDLEEEFAKMERNAEVKSQTSDDMFASESEDLDVVETTPQKRSPPRFISQSLQKIKERNETQSFLPPIESPANALSCLDVTLPPPLEFQDENVVNIPDSDVTLVSHIPPIDLEEDDEEDTLKKTPLLNENIDSSPPPSEKLLHLSPIRRERKVLNPLDVVHNSRFSPLDIVIKPQPQQKLIATSTPKQKSILNYIRTSQQSVFTINSTQEKKPCIACTRLTKEQVIAISTLTNRRLATYSSSFHPGVTHMIVSVNERNCVKDHTIKFVSAVASGIWVLSFDWIQESLAQHRIVPEEPFEALDVSGIAGPRTARLRGLGQPLLKGFRIYAAPPFLSTTRKDVEDIVRMLGGEIVSAPEDLLNKKKGIRVIITEARATQDFELYENWLERFGVVTVDIEWMSRSVGQYQLLSLRPFALCSDDSMANLGYPAELLVDTPFSFSQSMYSS